MMSIILPAARGGIITGIMLALSRVAGETAPLVFTAYGNTTFSMALNKPISALPLTIYNYVMSGDPTLQGQAEAGAILLVLLILITSLTARFMTRGMTMDNK
jgi:phosphate transport system permease protein